MVNPPRAEVLPSKVPAAAARGVLTGSCPPHRATMAPNLLPHTGFSHPSVHSVTSDSVTLIHGIPQARILEWEPFPSSGDLPNPGIESTSPVLQADSLPGEPQWKPKNTGLGSLSLLQQLFLTQGLNPGLLNCRQILYQLSSQGSP